MDFLEKAQQMDLDPAKDQNFMVDEKLLKKIAKHGKGKIVLEIGAGSGFLTKELVKVAEKVFAIENDEKFSEELKKTGAEVIIGDALGVEWPEFNAIVSNIPYKMCEPLVYALSRKKFEYAVLVISSGFYEKMVSDSKIGLISREVFIAEKLFDVPKKAFYPVPSCGSVAIKLIKSGKKTLLSELVKQHDKKLKNALREALCSFGSNRREARFLISRLEIEEFSDKRLKNLSKEEFMEFSEKLKKFTEIQS